MFIQGIASLGQIAASLATAATLSVATAVGGQGAVQGEDRIDFVSDPEGLFDLSYGGSRAVRFAETTPSFLTGTPKISRPVVQQAGFDWLIALGILGTLGILGVGVMIAKSIASAITQFERASDALSRTRAVPPVLPRTDQLFSLIADVRAGNLDSTGLARLLSILSARDNRANVALAGLFDFLPTQDPDSFDIAAVWQTLQAIASDPAHLLYDDVHLRLQRLASEERFTKTVLNIYRRLLADPQTKVLAERELRVMLRSDHATTTLAAQAALLLISGEGSGDTSWSSW